MKICKDCNIEKSLENYCKDAGSKSGFRHYCKACTKIRRKDYYEKHKELELTRANNYNLLNKERVKTNTKKWAINNKDRIRLYQKSKLKEDINFRLSKRLRNRLREALKNKNKIGSAVRDLGCSIQYLKIYLESKFQPGMTWDNYSQWHIDHIKPLSLFNLSIKEQLLEACHYTNLQPLWAIDNLRKSNKFSEVG